MSDSSGKPRVIRFNTEDDVVAEIGLLRRGSTRVGNWSLAQACWHLNAAYRFLMSAHEPTPNTPQQDAMRAPLQQLLAGAPLPAGIRAPEPLVPPENCDECAIDDLVETLGAVKEFPGPFRPHRIFGNLGVDEMRRLSLVHCARHLGHLLPTEQGT